MFYHGANNAVDDMRVVGAACILGIVTAIGWRRRVSRVAGRREEACLPALAGRGRCGQSLQILQTFAAEPRMYIKQFVSQVAPLGLLDACLTVSLGGEPDVPSTRRKRRE
jgi:hypothetical protein